MAEIAPFRGLLYNPQRVQASKVLAPPYDVIDSQGRQELAAKDANNCVRLILPEGDGDAKYQRAADTMQAWIREGVLVRDDRPAIYRYHQVFTSAELGDQPVTRRGFVAAVRLADFSEKIILPHERTLKGPKIDRLKLWKATMSHVSQVFGMYSDPSGETDRLFATQESETPFLDGVTDDGTRHRIWRVFDREVIGELARLMAPLKLYIADGHHRYETMLALRNHLREQAGGQLASKSAGEFGTLFVANMDDTGLVVLPTHRLIHGVADFSSSRLIDSLDKYFEVRELKGGASNADALRRAIDEQSGGQPSFGIVFPGQPDAWVASLNAGVDLAAAGVTGSPPVQRLDVTLLHTLVLENILGIDRAAQEAKTNIRYIKDTGQALQRAAAGEGQVCFIMGSPKLSQIRAVSDAGDVMPQKSTFFYPKIASGIVFHPIDPKEQLG